MNALDVLYVDNHLLVVCKPAGMPVQKDRSGDPDLLSVAKAYVKDRFDKPGNVFLGLVHRLDRPVSGVMVFGRTSKGAARLSDQIRRRTPTKRYAALVEGTLTGSGRLVNYLVKERGRVRVVAKDNEKARRAELSYRAEVASSSRSLVDVHLHTGRPHQIRVQLAQIGHPIVGDLRYGASSEHDGRNLALHCYEMAVQHPTKRVRMRWQAPPPKSWDADAREVVGRFMSDSAREFDLQEKRDA